MAETVATIIGIVALFIFAGCDIKSIDAAEDTCRQSCGGGDLSQVVKPEKTYAGYSYKGGECRCLTK